MGLNIIKLREYREKSGLSQLGLDRLAQVGLGTVNKIERGKTNPTVDTVDKIAKALSVPLASLLN